MNSFKPRIATAIPKALDVRLEIIEAARAFAAQEEDEWLCRRRAEIAAIGRDLESLRRALPELIEQCRGEVRRECASLLRPCLLKYSPD
jgi:hypothetical protein